MFLGTGQGLAWPGMSTSQHPHCTHRLAPLMMGPPQASLVRLLWREFLHLLRLLLLERCPNPGIEEFKQTYYPAQGHENRAVTSSGHRGFIGDTDDSRRGLRTGMKGLVRLPRALHSAWDREDLGSKEPCRQGEGGEGHGRSLGLQNMREKMRNSQAKRGTGALSCGHRHKSPSL